MSSRRSHRPASAESELGMILVDYDDLFERLADRTDGGDQPHRFLLAMIAELRRYLQDELGIRATRAVAYGDFTRHSVDAGTILNDLSASGVEAQHVPSTLATGDAAVSLTLHASEQLYVRRDTGAYVILSGANWYRPLVEHLQRNGKFVLVAALDIPTNLGSLHGAVADAFLNARFLLDSRTRDAIRESIPADSPVGLAASAAGVSAQTRAPAEVADVEDEGARHALEIIEEFFGQYEEVYLTPLLRKLTETLENEDGEPKDLVSALQDAGAVWLEKRRGFPYDYTVLLVNAEHPDVKRVREAFAEFGGDGRADDDYDEEDDEDYDDDGTPFEDDYDADDDTPAT